LDVPAFKTSNVNTHLFYKRQRYALIGISRKIAQFGGFFEENPPFSAGFRIHSQRRFFRGERVFPVRRPRLGAGYACLIAGAPVDPLDPGWARWAGRAGKMPGGDTRPADGHGAGREAFDSGAWAAWLAGCIQN